MTALSSKPCQISMVVWLSTAQDPAAAAVESNQLHAVVATGPETIRENIGKLPLAALVARVRKLRGTLPTDATSPAQRVLKGQAKRYEQLDAEVHTLDAELETLVKETASDLLSPRGVGVNVAGTLPVAAGDNP